MNDRSLILLLAVIVTIGSVATNVYIPALPAVRIHFDATVAEAQSTFSVALVTFAVGMLLWGPISDRYGRRSAILAGIAIMSLGSAIALAAPTLGWLAAGRAVQAFGTATGIAVARAIISDRFPPERMARALAQLAIVAVIASGTAPILGGYLTEGFGWRAVFVALLATAAFIGWFAWRWLPETRGTDTRPAQPRDMVRTAGRLVRTPMYLSCVFQVSFSYSMFMVLVTLAPYVMVQALGRPATDYGFYYLFVAVGYVLGNWGVGRFAARGQHWTVVFGSTLQLGGALAALVFGAVGLEHPLWIFAPMGIVYLGQGLFIPHLTAIAVGQAPPQSAGVASSTLGFANQVFAALCVQLMGLQGSGTALPMLTFCAVAALAQFAILRASPRMEAAGRAA